MPDPNTNFKFSSKYLQFFLKKSYCFEEKKTDNKKDNKQKNILLGSRNFENKNLNFNSFKKRAYKIADSFYYVKNWIG